MTFISLILIIMENALSGEAERSDRAHCRAGFGQVPHSRARAQASKQGVHEPGRIPVNCANPIITITGVPA